jgi:hypothetical protein
MDQILAIFATMGGDEREKTMRALASMMREDSQPQPTKKKVNGFMGYRGKIQI